LRFLSVIVRLINDIPAVNQRQVSLTLKTSQVALNGRTATPTIRSATARLTMNMFVTLLSLLVQKTANMTRTLPTTTMTLTIARTIRVTTFHTLDHSTPSYKAAHAVAFSSRILVSSRGPQVRPCDPKHSPVEELACYRQGVRSRARTPTDTLRHVTWDCGPFSARTLTQVYLYADYRHWSAQSPHMEHSQDRKCTRDRSPTRQGPQLAEAPAFSARGRHERIEPRIDLPTICLLG